MAFRDDAVGMFWLTQEREKKAPDRVPRVLPPTPETNWRPPSEFPNLSAAKLIAVDVETKDLELREKGPGVRRGSHIVGLAIGVDTGERWYFPVRHEVEAEYNLRPDAVFAWAKESLAGPQPKVGANILYDADFLAGEQVALGGPWLDVQTAEPLLDENRRTYNLDVLGEEYLGERKAADALAVWVRKAYNNTNYREEIWRTSPRLAGPYAEGDVDLPLRILEKQLQKLDEQELTDLFQLECDLLPMLLAMRQFGVRIDQIKRQQVEDELTQEIQTQQKRIDLVAGFQVNVNSGAHLARAFDKVGVPYPRTAQGAPSFTKNYLEHVEAPIAIAVVELRKFVKLKQFVESFAEFAINGRIHTSFHPVRTDDHGTVSGRFASSDPNLQNIPIRDPVWGPRLRSIFIPEEGCEWVRHDWSQIEYRFLAHFARGSAGEAVRKQYRDDPSTDFHIMVSELTGLDRKPAKNLNFGLVYGMGAKELARRLGMSVEQAQEEVFGVYHERAPFVKATYDFAASRAAMRGYVKTFLGRRARFDMFSPIDWNQEGTKGDDPVALPEKQARGKWGNAIRRAFTHKALNRVLQGSAADLMKKAMRDIWRSGVYRVLPVAHLTVHDELDHSRPRTKQAEQAIREVKHIMETALELKVPVIADEDRGPSWGEAK